ncbi:hypothetical protein [Delftia tsuruhatensis]|jgi:hypothetical protein|uniref:Uncharacterized protein n=1 Tax=Delftia tsuruhatensis TaxID=180282 RepID=A0AAX3SL55_9BURK|nr:hypothetical protein [Delftia tsuruhatensis]WFF80718.1 hypothetical protein PYR84_27960 [Delftia tsuruhatensis]
MLETFPQLHQGLGLHGQPGAAAPSSLRVLAMLRDTAADPEGQSEQSLLWPVCASLQRLGMPVLVLDASQGEAADAPGLAQLLQQSAWQARTGLHPDPRHSSVAVLPARQGLELLPLQARQAGMTPMQWLQRHVRGYAIVMLYADADTLARNLPGQAVHPLMVLPEHGPRVLGCYRQLKQLAVHAGLRCLLAPLLPGADPVDVTSYDWRRGQTGARSQAEDAQRRQSQIDALLRCAQRHLGHAPGLLPVRLHHAPDLQRLALQLLNHAGSVLPHGGQVLAAGYAPLPASHAWSH